MPVRFLAAHPQVQDLQGKVAVIRGPVVYCAEFPETQDNAQTPLENVFLAAGSKLRPVTRKDFLGGVVVLEGKALTPNGREDFLRLNPTTSSRANSVDWTRQLYGPAMAARNAKLPETGVIDLTLIPYYAWANRGQGQMAVWMNLPE